ncbi:MAG TPA: preprotein translocase subunit YajC [Urbifossiella sp.]|jgi:preprotein translocase subunit YajC|nr:preprotein translocase subunit YajC [Urbifossiella sp.]
MLSVLFAQEPGAAPGQVQPFWANPIFLMLMVGMFWVVVILPMSRRQKKEQQQLMASLKRGTKVVTSGGIIGSIVSIKDGEDEVTIRSEDSRIKVLRSSILRAIGTDEAESAK